jgi:hypothetical protein
MFQLSRKGLYWHISYLKRVEEGEGREGKDERGRKEMEERNGGRGRKGKEMEGGDEMDMAGKERGWGSKSHHLQNTVNVTVLKVVPALLVTVHSYWPA